MRTRNVQIRLVHHLFSLVYFLCPLPKRQHNEEDVVGPMDKEATLVGHVQVTLSEDPIRVQEANDTSSSKVRSQESSRCNCTSPVLRVKISAD